MTRAMTLHRGAMPEVGNPLPGNPTSLSAPHRIAKLAQLAPLDGAWLDIGCGSGSYTALLAERGCRPAIGIDLALRQPLERVPGNTFGIASSDRLPFPSRQLDGVLLNEVLEHVANQDATLREVRRVLKPSGRLVLFSPNRWFPFEGHGASIGRFEIEVPVPVLPWLPARVSHRWMRARNYWPSELRRAVEGAGFRVEELGFAYPLFAEFPWLPGTLSGRVRQWAPRLETTVGLRRFGVSTMIIARPTGTAAAGHS